jgi:general secretion pathway protein I
LSRKPSDRRRKARGTRGFTLIEVIVALAIAGFGLATLVAAAGTGLGNAKLAGQYVEAARRAQSHLASLGVEAPLAAGEWSGDDGGGYLWRVRVSPPAARADATKDDDDLPSVYTIEATVSWQNGDRARSVTLRSQRMAKIGKPDA